MVIIEISLVIPRYTMVMVMVIEISLVIPRYTMVNGYHTNLVITRCIMVFIKLVGPRYIIMVIIQV